MKTKQVEIYAYVHYETTQPLDSSDDGNDFILDVTGTIYGEPQREGNENFDLKLKLGEVKLMVVQVGDALGSGASLFEVFDTHQQTHDIGCSLYNSSFNDHSAWVKKRFDPMSLWDDILILDRLTLEPAARGQGLGLVVLDRAIRDWSGGCSLVAMKPFPLQYEGGDSNPEKVAKLKLQEFTTGKAESFRRLRAYYAKMGFDRIGRSDIYVFCTQNTRPALKDLSLPAQFTLPADFVSMKEFRSNGH